MNKLQFLEKRCRNQRHELSRLNKKFAGWWCYLRRVYNEPDSPLAQLTVLQHKFKPVEKERNKLRHENKQLKKRVAELEAVLDEVGPSLLSGRHSGRIMIGDYVCNGTDFPNLYKWLKEKQNG